jgi:hypothetical protein
MAGIIVETLLPTLPMLLLMMVSFLPAFRKRAPLERVRKYLSM